MCFNMAKLSEPSTRIQDVRSIRSLQSWIAPLSELSLLAAQKQLQPRQTHLWRLFHHGLDTPPTLDPVLILGHFMKLSRIYEKVGPESHTNLFPGPQKLCQLPLSPQSLDVDSGQQRHWKYPAELGPFESCSVGKATRARGRSLVVRSSFQYMNHRHQSQLTKSLCLEHIPRPHRAL